MMSKFPVYPEAKLLIESFEDVKNNGISTFDSDISSLLGSLFDYKKGREMCKEYLGNMSTSAPDIEKQLKCIPVTNILLTSLLDVIPSGVKLDGGMKITYYGIYFQSLISGPEIYARYCTQIHSFLLSFSRLIVTDIFAETERMSYFLNFLKNRYVIPDVPDTIRDIKGIDRVNANRLIGTDENVEIHNKDIKKPLLHFLTGKSLDDICGFNVRIFLRNIFTILPEDIDTWTHVFFHDSGIYYRTRENSEIRFLQANQRYISHFEIEDSARDFISNSQKGISYRKELSLFDGKVNKAVDDILNTCYTNTITEHLESSSPLDIFIIEMKDNFGIPVFVKNLIRFPEILETKKLNNLVRVFSDITPIIRDYFQDGMLFGKNMSCSPDVSLSDIGIAFKRNQSEFLSPTFMKQYFSGGKKSDGTLIHSDMYIHECEYLQKYEQYYPFFMYLFFGKVFKKLLHLAQSNLVYKEILEHINLLVQGQLSQELQSLNRNGFNPKSELAKNTVLINYFMRYACAYIMEKKGKPLKVTIPEGWRIFLRDKIFFDHERIS